MQQVCEPDLSGKRQVETRQHPSTHFHAVLGGGEWEWGGLVRRACPRRAAPPSGLDNKKIAFLAR